MVLPLYCHCRQDIIKVVLSLLLFLPLQPYSLVRRAYSLERRAGLTGVCFDVDGLEVAGLAGVAGATTGVAGEDAGAAAGGAG